MRAITAGFVYFAIIFAAGFAMGTVRVPFLVPRLGVRTAELLEMPVMFVVIVIAARYVVKRFAVPAAARTRLLVGFIALGALIAAELLLTAALQEQSIAQYIAGRDPVSGSVYLAMLALLAVMPLVLARLRDSRVLSAHDRA